MRMLALVLLIGLALLSFGTELFTQFGPPSFDKQWQPQMTHRQYRQVASPAQAATLVTQRVSRPNEYTRRPNYSRPRYGQLRPISPKIPVGPP